MRVGPRFCHYTDNIKYCLSLCLLVFTLSLWPQIVQAQSDTGSDQDSDKKTSYAKVLYMQECSQRYYYHFNPGDKLNAEQEQQMINHIKASCQCMYKNLRQVFSKMDIMHFVQSLHASSRQGRRALGNKPDQVLDMMTSDELREECRHLNNMGEAN